jgi:hypothetical protein
MQTPLAEKNPMHEKTLMFEKSQGVVKILLSEEVHTVLLY